MWRNAPGQVSFTFNYNLNSNKQILDWAAPDQWTCGNKTWGCLLISRFCAETISRQPWAFARTENVHRIRCASRHHGTNLSQHDSQSNNKTQITLTLQNSQTQPTLIPVELLSQLDTGFALYWYRFRFIWFSLVLFDFHRVPWNVWGFLGFPNVLLISRKCNINLPHYRN